MAAGTISLRKGVRFRIEHDPSDSEAHMWTGTWLITDARGNKGREPTIEARRLLAEDGGVTETFYSNSVHQYMSAASAAGPAVASDTAAAGSSPYMLGAVPPIGFRERTQPVVRAGSGPMQGFLTSMARQASHHVFALVEKHLGKGLKGICLVFESACNPYRRHEVNNIPHCVFAAMFLLNRALPEGMVVEECGQPGKTAADPDTGEQVKVTATRVTVSFLTLRAYAAFACTRPRITQISHDGKKHHVVLAAWKVTASFTASHPSWAVACKANMQPLELDLEVATTLLTETAQVAAQTAKMLRVYSLDRRRVGKKKEIFYLCIVPEAVSAQKGALYEILPGVNMFGRCGWVPATALKVQWYPHAHFTKKITSAGVEIFGDTALALRPTTLIAASGFIEAG